MDTKAIREALDKVKFGLPITAFADLEIWLRQLLDENGRLRDSAETWKSNYERSYENYKSLLDENERQDEKIKSLQQDLNAKLVFINNGWEEERYALQESEMHLQEENARLKADNARTWKVAEDYKDKMVEANKKNYLMSHEIERLKADKALAIDALQWYADEDHYEMWEGMNIGLTNDVSYDNGNKARTTLEQLKRE